MAARSMPNAGVPETQDVNERVEFSSNSTVEEGNVDNAFAETSTHDDEVHLTEADVKELEHKPIPYKRFREVNERTKVLEREKDSIVNKYEDEIKSLTRQYEAKLSTKQEPEAQFSYEYDTDENRQVKDLQKTIDSLSNQLNDLRVDQTKQTRSLEIERLQNQFPKADALAVKGWSMAYPEASLEELMAKSHDTNNAMIQNSINELISKKKERAKATSIPTGRGSAKLKPEEKPKTLQEATRMARQWLQNY